MPPPTTTRSKVSELSASRAASRESTAASLGAIDHSSTRKPVWGAAGIRAAMFGRIALLATAGALALVPAAQAQLPLPLPGAGGAVDQVTGLVGGLAPPAPAPAQDALDQLLAGGLPSLDPSALDGLLGTLGLPAA